MPTDTAAASGGRNRSVKQCAELGQDGVRQAARMWEHWSMQVGTHQRRAEAVVFARSVAPWCCLALRRRYDGYTKQHTMLSADGIECIMFAGDEQFSQVFSRTISKSFTSLSC